MITVSQWPRLDVAALATPSISLAYGRDALVHARDDAADLLCAFTGALGAERGVAALADQAADLAVEIAHGIGNLLRGLASALRQALHFARDHRKAAAGGSGARRLDRGIERQQVGLLRNRLDRAGNFCNLRQGRADGAEPGLDAADRLDEFGDVPDRRIDRAARLHDLDDGRGRGRLHRLRCIGDVAVGRDHRLGRLLEVVEPLRLVRDAACDLLDVAGDIGKLHAEAADAVGKLVNQPFGQRLVGFECPGLQAAQTDMSRAFSSQSR